MNAGIVNELVAFALAAEISCYLHSQKDKMWQERQEAMLEASIYIACSSSIYIGHKNDFFCAKKVSPVVHSSFQQFSPVIIDSRIKMHKMHKMYKDVGLHMH